MPASLLFAAASPRGVSRNESTRSDSSNTSQSSLTGGNKKVSFNKAVRVKKYSRKPSDAEPNDNDDSTGKRFWFKVYKNKHRQSPDPSEFRRRNEVIYYGNDDAYTDDVISYHPNPSSLNYPIFTSECATQTPRKTTERTALLGNEFTPLHPSQMPSDPPDVRRNYVKKIVNRFNEEAVLQRQRSTEGYPSSPPASPPGSPRMHSTPKNIPIPPPPPPPTYGFSFDPHHPPLEGPFAPPKAKKNIVNGVKVMFDDDKKANRSNDAYQKDSYDPAEVPNGYYTNKNGRSYKTDIVLSDSSETDVKSPYPPQETFHFGDLDHHNQLMRRNNNVMDLSHRRENHDNGSGYGYDDRDEYERRGKHYFETFDSGNRLLFDKEDVNTATNRTDKGEFTSTVGEKHQVWGNNKRVIVYEDPSPTIIRRKAKSQTDLSRQLDQYSHEEKLDKGVSTEELFSRKTEKKDTVSKGQKDSWLRHFRSATKDKGIQCNKIPTDEPEELYGFGKYRIIRPRNGVVSAFSNVPKLDKTKQNDVVQSSQVNGYNNKDSSVIYSQIDKSKKKKEKKKNLFSEDGRIGSLFKSRSEPLYIGPPPKSPQHLDEDVEGSYLGENREQHVKTSKRSFGFRINTGKEDLRKSPYYEDDWYNIDGEVEAIERQKRRGRNHRDIAEVRQQIAEEEISDASSLSNGDHKRNGRGAGSVMREVNYKKKEISYENVPRSDGESNGHANERGGLWYRDADEDYRREMAQSEVSYPNGNSVVGDRFYTIDRREKSNKKPPPSPRAYTLDRRHLQGKNNPKPVPNTTGVKILVNGKEVKEKSSGKKSKKRDDPSSVQSDPLCVRGGLAAAYQARQRAAVSRSSSSVSGLRHHGGSTPNIRRIAASSEHSGASSGSESSRRPLVMYIPGISHSEKPSNGEDRVSTIARSQSMMSPTRPPRIAKRVSHKAHRGSKMDLYRNRDIYEEDEIMPLASDINRKKPPKVPSNSRKNGDIKRSHSMPKDNKFSWLKWKLRGKPSREP